MTKAHTSISAPRSQAMIFIGISAGIVALSSIGHARDPHLFEPFLGPLPPSLACLVVAAMGGAGLFMLAPRGFCVVAEGSLDALGRRSSLAAAFGLVAILVDTTVVFPADMNVRFPESLVFYPAIGFVVEILFHVLPLALILHALTSLTGRPVREGVVSAAIFTVALLEPTFQTLIGFSGPYPVWISIWVWVHVFLINLSQLIIFKRVDFVAMILFRLAYYVVWHIAWGQARLHLLF